MLYLFFEKNKAYLKQKNHYYLTTAPGLYRIALHTSIQKAFCIERANFLQPLQFVFIILLSFKMVAHCISQCLVFLPTFGAARVHYEKYSPRP